MTLINSLPQLLKNTLYLEEMLISSDALHKEKAKDLIFRGTCFIRYLVDERVLFAPSRFIGYIDNTILNHIESKPHGSITNNRINRIIGQQPIESERIEEEYKQFCRVFGIVPKLTGNFGTTRKFWDLENMFTNVYGDVEYDEGRKKNATHILRERNPRVRQQAINNFLSKNLTLYCEACHFDFEKKYGEIGKDFIECHHTIPFSKMQTGHKTKVEDIVLLCSNCHRMIHRRSNDWLTLNQLQEMLKRQNGYS